MQASSDFSVEDLLRMVRALPAEASAVAAVREGLGGLDSGALAALLKELAKGGLGKRAIEIFDWLRSLDERSEFGLLCDVYTCASDHISYTLVLILAAPSK